MAKQKTYQKYIYKLSSKQLRDAAWHLTLPLSEAVAGREYLVSVNDSQLLRFIDGLRGVTDREARIGRIRAQLRRLKAMPYSKSICSQITDLYRQMYHLQFIEDYVLVTMDSMKDYDCLNKGFTVNGIPYRRLLGTNGGIKTSTIVYVSQALYPELKRLIDNGRNLQMPLVPAKLEAYQALVCSGSTPVSMPDGIIVVKDCITHFQDDVLLIDDSEEGEPRLTYLKEQEIEYIDSDGYGLMLPSYSRRIYRELEGSDYHIPGSAGSKSNSGGNDSDNDGSDGSPTGTPLYSGVNIRYAWTKGMLFTFDYLDFARKIAGGQYIIQDAWGDFRDLRQAEVILTTSMLKLWDSYDSWEDYAQNCQENGYQFSIAKTTPLQLEHTRNANYQFLQSFHFTDEELYQLCRPTIEEIKGAMGMDYRKSLVFLKGMYLTDEKTLDADNDIIKALMIEPRMIEDPFIREKIHSMIQKRIQMAKKGSIQLPGNFAMVCGDPYALAQSMLGLPVTGLLQRGQVYHKYWLDRGVSEISCFRAPMTCHNNIRKVEVASSSKMSYWYRYITTAMILNAHDTLCDAMNGQDKDSDSDFTTNHPIILKNTRPLPAIHCVQRKAAKIIPAEEDLIRANKLAFGDAIGTTTNYITAMFERQAGFPADSLEYRILEYRIMCGQLYQQNAIDRAKGIIAKPMPRAWYDASVNQPDDSDDEQTRQKKELNLRILADKKPYFMRYVYPKVMEEYKAYMKKTGKKAMREFQLPLEQLLQKENPSSEEEKFLEYFRRDIPTGQNPCVVNRICRIFEQEFDEKECVREAQPPFDYTILKSDAAYTPAEFRQLKKLHEEYTQQLQYYHQCLKQLRTDSDKLAMMRQTMIARFRAQAEEICPDSRRLCNILLDLCYSSRRSKQFVWDVCGKTIIQNLLETHRHTLYYPRQTEGPGEFTFGGCRFIMTSVTERRNSSVEG